MIFITILFWVSTFFLLRVKFSENLNPLIFIFHYFYGMLVFSQLSLTGIPKPTDLTVFYFLVSYVSALLGVMINKAKGISVKDGLRKNYKRSLYVVILLAFLPLTYILLKNISVLLGGYEYFVRSVRFENDTLSITGSTMLASLVDRVVRPVSIFSAVIGVSFYLITKKKLHLFLGCYLLVVFSVLYVKRVDLMFLLAMFIGGGLSMNMAGTWEKYKNYIYIILILFFVSLISSFRSPSYSFYQLILHYGIGYHTFGFALFDRAINDPSSYVHDFVFPGVTIFATLDFFMNQIYKVFDVAHTPISSYLYSNELGDFVFMGYNNFNGKEISPNAFYTSLYPIYRDMKFLGLIVVPLIYGYLYAGVYKKFKFDANVTSLAWVVYLTYVGYASLLTPVIMGNTFWIVPLLLLFFSKFLSIGSK